MGVCVGRGYLYVSVHVLAFLTTDACEDGSIPLRLYLSARRRHRRPTPAAPLLVQRHVERVTCYKTVVAQKASQHLQRLCIFCSATAGNYLAIHNFFTNGLHDAMSRVFASRNASSTCGDERLAYASLVYDTEGALSHYAILGSRAVSSLNNRPTRQQTSSQSVLLRLSVEV